MTQDSKSTASGLKELREIAGGPWTKPRPRDIPIRLADGRSGIYRRCGKGRQGALVEIGGELVRMPWDTLAETTQAPEQRT